MAATPKPAAGTAAVGSFPGPCGSKRQAQLGSCALLGVAAAAAGSSAGGATVASCPTLLHMLSQSSAVSVGLLTAWVLPSDTDYARGEAPWAEAYQSPAYIIRLTSHGPKPAVWPSPVSRRAGAGKDGSFERFILCVPLSGPTAPDLLRLALLQGSQASGPFSSNPYLLRPTSWHPIQGPVLLDPRSMNGLPALGGDGFVSGACWSGS